MKYKTQTFEEVLSDCEKAGVCEETLAYLRAIQGTQEEILSDPNVTDRAKHWLEGEDT